MTVLFFKPIGSHLVFLVFFGWFGIGIEIVNRQASLLDK